MGVWGLARGEGRPFRVGELRRGGEGVGFGVWWYVGWVYVCPSKEGAETRLDEMTRVEHTSI